MRTSYSISYRVVKTISGHGHGWAFSAKDFARLGSRESIDISLHRLANMGTIRRVIRGIYDYPKHSELLGQMLSPDLDQVADALGRKFGWRIQVAGAYALNILALSTQVPGRVVYASDGPNRSFIIGKHTLEFKHTSLKDTGFKLKESSLIVQGLKSLGEERVSSETIETIREWLDPRLRERVLDDTRRTTGWIYATIMKICQERS